jgi:nitroreductase
MDYQTIIDNRRSLRVYDTRIPDRKTLLDCLDAARIAPSGENLQPWRFIVIDEPSLRSELATAASSGIYLPTKFIRKAPVLIAVLAQTDVKVNRIGTFLQGIQFYLLDLGIACQQLVLKAEDLGLGSCFIGWFNVDKARTILALPKKEKLVCLISLGFPPQGYQAPQGHKRKSLADIVRFNRD